MNGKLTSRDRVRQMLAFRPVDIPALECDLIPVGLYEHGEKARALMKTCEGDFNPISDSTFIDKPNEEETYRPKHP